MKELTIKHLLYALMACVLIMTTSCEDLSSMIDNPTGSYLEIKTDSVVMSPGESYLIEATTISDEPITYVSSDTEVATVDASGCVKATGEGVATITISVAANTVYAAASVGFQVTVRKTDIQAPLTLVAQEDGIISVFIGSVKLQEPICYSILRGTSGSFTKTTDIPVKKGDKVELSSKNKSLANAAHKFVNIKPQMTCTVYGNVMSMISPNGNWMVNKTITEDFALTNLFLGADKLVNDASRDLLLPATSLSKNCYSYMFSGCTGLTRAPSLPAMELKDNCYTYMFGGCTSLTKVPDLQATTLAAACYSDMFNGCKALTEGPQLAATELADYCYSNMFSGCTALTSAPVLSATTMKDYCYSNMFYGCTSLTAVPALPAGTLAPYCYYQMFQDCTALTEAGALPAMTLKDCCYTSMFEHCTALEFAPALPATTLASDCYRKMFTNCTSLTTAPVLPATTLTSYCYTYMFYGCAKLNGVKCLATTGAKYALLGWLSKAGTAVTQPTLARAADNSNWIATADKPTTANQWYVPLGWAIVSE